MKEVKHIEVKEVFPFAELEERLRKVKVSYKDKEIYQDAAIKLIDYEPSQLNLTTNYLLREHLLFQENLRDHLWSRFGIDPFHLSGLVILEEPEGLYSIAPPIIEHLRLPFASPQQMERGCTNISLDMLLDGAHRSYLAMLGGEDIRCVHVSDVPELYQVPIIPNSWDEVMIVDVLPERRFKKRYLGDSITMYRDFSSLGSRGYRR